MYSNSYDFLNLLHLLLKCYYINFMVYNLLHLWLVSTTFMVGIRLMVDFYYIYGSVVFLLCLISIKLLGLGQNAR